MEFRNLGSSGLRVSALGIGCNNFGGRSDFAASQAVVHKALDLGITHFDTADIYGGSGQSESFLGRILGDRRKDVVLATKFGLPFDASGAKQGGSRRYVMAAVEDSLRRLNTDWIDLYYLHKPDPLTPIGETLRALDDLVRQGKVRYVAASNLAAWQVTDAVWTARTAKLTGFVATQDEYSLLMRRPEQELVPALRHHGLGLVPYYPLAAGLLTGKYARGGDVPAGSRYAKVPGLVPRFMSDGNWTLVDQLAAFAAARGKDIVDVAFAWLLSRPVVSSVIAGASSAAQVERNVKAAAWRFTAEEAAEIDRISGAA
jgi:aryl-alcohol dehydrogenase-like predicted oxidoreductase